MLAAHSRPDKLVYTVVSFNNDLNDHDGQIRITVHGTFPSKELAEQALRDARKMNTPANQKIGAYHVAITNNYNSERGMRDSYYTQINDRGQTQQIVYSIVENKESALSPDRPPRR